MPASEAKYRCVTVLYAMGTTRLTSSQFCSMSKIKTPGWVVRLRTACPKGWSVKESRGFIRLSLAGGASGVNGASKTLPLAWAADAVPDAIALINRLDMRVQDGFDLADALAHESGSAPAAKPGASTQWPTLLEKFHDDLQILRPIKADTWQRNYAPALNRAVDLLTGANAPVNARDLGSAVIAIWAEQPGERHKAIDALRKFLDFCVEVHHLPAASWTLSDRAAKALKGNRSSRQRVACPSDVEILRLLSLLPESAAGKRWWNAIALMALYGLRPVEVNSVVVRNHPVTGQPALYCPRPKVSSRGESDPRWLVPLPLTDSTGEQVDWNLIGAMTIGQLPLPDLAGNKNAAKTFLNRQQYWADLKQQYDDCGEWLKPYSFRNAYCLRGHRATKPAEHLANWMGHSLAVHLSSYEWYSQRDVLEHI